MKKFNTTRNDEALVVKQSGLSLHYKTGAVRWETLLSETVALYLVDNKQTLEIEIERNGETESFSVHFEPVIYEELKRYLKSSLANVTIRPLSIFRQLSFASTMISSLGFIFGALYYFSRQVEVSGKVRTGKNVVMNDVINYLTATVGSQMILIVGCILVGLFLLMFIKILIAPKKGCTIDYAADTYMVKG